MPEALLALATQDIHGPRVEDRTFIMDIFTALGNHFAFAVEKSLG